MSFVLPGSAIASRVRILAWSNSEYEFLHQRFETFHERLEHVYSQAEMPAMPAASPSSNSSINRNIFGPYGIVTRSSCSSFRSTSHCGGIVALKLPARSPNLNAFAERWVRSVKQKCLSKLILFGEVSLRRALAEYLTH